MDPKTITINGVTHTVREWSELSGINRCTINSRLRKGVTGIDLIAPVKNNRLPPITHICKYLEDPDGVDSESGLPHLWHVACNVAFLIALNAEKCPTSDFNI